MRWGASDVGQIVGTLFMGGTGKSGRISRDEGSRDVYGDREVSTWQSLKGHS